MKRGASGYIAITSAIIIAALLIVIVFTVSLVTFLGLSGISDSYYKGKSRALAEGCVETARLKLATNSSYGGGETIAVGSDSCSIVSVTTSGSQKIIQASASYQGAPTYLKVTVNASDLSLVSWEEMQHF